MRLSWTASIVATWALVACGPGVIFDETDVAPDPAASDPGALPMSTPMCEGDGTPCTLPIDGTCQPLATGALACTALSAPAPSNGTAHPPPPAAIDACAGAAETSACAFVLDGNCQARDGSTICVPDEEPPLCTPACVAMECGDDGCGGSCGVCGEQAFCQADGTCAVVVCQPSCVTMECGDDGCGGSCGTCGEGTFCQADGACGAVACVPSCAGLECGDDGCGGRCGACAAEHECQAGACVRVVCTVTVSGSCLAGPGGQPAVCVAPPTPEAFNVCSGAAPGQVCTLADGAAGRCQGPPGAALACAIEPPIEAADACSGQAQSTPCSYPMPAPC